LKAYKGFVIDMDGVLWREHAMLPGVEAFFQTLRAQKLPFVLATNNSTQTVDNVQALLAQANVEIEPRDVLTSSSGVARFLQRDLPDGAGLFVIGGKALEEALQDSGFKLLHSAEGVQAVVVGMDPSLDWNKLTEATYAIRAGAKFFGTNPDRTFPTERGLGPGAGAILSALQTSTNVEPRIFGKPEPYLFEEALVLLQSKAAEVAAIGDRLETDICGGQRAGMDTILLLTGVTSRKVLESSTIKPSSVFADLPELTKALQQRS
jgi:4-nitrophenyl phosphatase